MRIHIFILTAALLLIFGNLADAASTEASAPYTIMLYMNGSDLESEIGAATIDLAEILDSGLRNSHVVILTGGTLYWQNPVVPDSVCVLWHIENGELHKLEEWGKISMGASETLARFISHAKENFPAERYGLILWDHGGGAIAGYGHDELHYDSALTLMDLEKAFSAAGLGSDEEEKLEWLGFDSCLMATVEMAAISEPYARYLVASEDLEPADGWDYGFLAVLNENPQADGLEIGTRIVDSFMDFYGEDKAENKEILTLSVTDLSRIAPVTEAMGALMARAHDQLLPEFAALAHRRQMTKTFGEGSPRDNYSDMVDAGDMAVQLGTLFPAESEALIHALQQAVKYNRYNSDTDLYGLSSFYIYGGKSMGEESLALYRELNFSEDYTRYLEDFFRILVLSPRTERTGAKLSFWQRVPEKAGYYTMLSWRNFYCEGENTKLWAFIEEEPVCLYECGEGRYAIPAVVNGKDGDIIVAPNSFVGDAALGVPWKYGMPRDAEGGVPYEKILGFRAHEGQVKQKGLTEILPGDTVAFWYPQRSFIRGGELNWTLGESFVIKKPPVISYKEPSGSYYTSIVEIDALNNLHYGALNYVEN